jgi:hypothetical protein
MLALGRFLLLCELRLLIIVGPCAADMRPFTECYEHDKRRERLAEHQLNLAQSRPQHERRDRTPFRYNNIGRGTFSRPGIPPRKHTCRFRYRMAWQRLSFCRYHCSKSTIEPEPVYRIVGQLLWLCQNSESKPIELGWTVSVA